LAAFALPAVAADRCGGMPAAPALGDASAADPDMSAFQNATVAESAYLTESETYRNCVGASGADDADARIDASNAAETRARDDFAAWQSAYASAHAAP
jgi:hypothetical protein